MKKLLHIFFVITLLVLPVLAQALPCNMAMMDMPQQAMAGHSMAMESSQEPCPHHKQTAAIEECDNLMSVAECLDIDKITTTDGKVSAKLTKGDAVPVIILPETFATQMLDMLAIPRAPPQYDSTCVPTVSLILTTQRFRV